MASPRAFLANITHIMYSGPIHAGVCVRKSFLLKAEYYPTVWMYHVTFIFFIHCAEELDPPSQLLRVNNAAVSMGSNPKPTFTIIFEDFVMVANAGSSHIQEINAVPLGRWRCHRSERGSRRSHSRI